MYRAAVFALFASTLLVAGAARAQQICCVSAGPDGLRGYANPQYPPPQYAQPQYAQPQYAQPPYGDPQYGQPQYQPRPTSSGLRGYVGVDYGKARLEPGTPSPRIETWTGEAAASGEVGRLGVQGDVKVASYNTKGPGGDGTQWSPTLHVYERNAYGLIGGWTGWSHTKGADLFGIGLEGQAYMGGATLYGSVGYGHVNGAIDQNLWTARLEGRYFVTENLAVNVNGGLVRDSASGAHTTARDVGVGAEYQPGVAPISILAGYDHASASGSTAKADTIRVGLRWNFDGGSLAERDRLGPSLNNITDLFLSN
jgi:hypothetical protein